MFLSIMKPTAKTRPKLTDEQAMRRLARWSRLGLPLERLAEISGRSVAQLQKMMASDAYVVTQREIEEQMNLPYDVLMQQLYEQASQVVSEWLGKLEGPADRRRWH